MTPERTELFIALLDIKLSDAHPSDSELAKQARISHSVLRKRGQAFCQSTIY